MNCKKTTMIKSHSFGFFALTALFVSAVITVSTPFAARAQNDSKPATTQTVPSPVPASTENQRYRIGAGDLLDIHILNRPNLSRDSVRVDGSGMIRMPLIDSDIQAACKSEGELAKEISTRYLKFYRNAQVDVFVKEFHAREVALIGAVNQQGRYQMQRRLRLLELLTFAKGTSDKAGQTINIIRGPRTDLCTNSSDPANDAGGFISLRLNDTLRGEEKANPYMEAGDIVTIPEADQVYVVGNVYHPQPLSLKGPITVSQAVAMAGGALRDSKTDKVHIIRQVPGSGGQSELYVSLKDIASKKAEDVRLVPNDIVEVSESTSKSLLRSLMGAAAQLPIRAIP
jgi:polysaccharide export outer membrane protein